jgi:hypothetical protein
LSCRIYLNFILYDGTDPTNTGFVPMHISRDFTANPACLSWFNRTLQFLVQYKSVLKAEQQQQMRKVELYSVHAIIAASWATHYPMSWGIMAKGLASYQDTQAELEWDEQRRRSIALHNRAVEKAAADELPPPAELVIKPHKKRARVTRQSKLDQQLLDFARAVGVKGDWPALVHSFAVSYLSQLGHTRLYEEEVLEQVDKCIALYTAHKRLGVCDGFNELDAQIGMYEPAAAAADSDEPRRLWQFSAPVAAISCVRKVMQDKFLPYDEAEAKHCVVKSFKPQWAKKRSRPAPTKNSVASKLKAARFAQVAGVSARDVTACMDLLL